MTSSDALSALASGDTILAVAIAEAHDCRPEWRDLEARGLRWPSWTASPVITKRALAHEVLRLREALRLASVVRQPTLWEEKGEGDG